MSSFRPATRLDVVTGCVVTTAAITKSWALVLLALFLIALSVIDAAIHSEPK